MRRNLPAKDSAPEHGRSPYRDIAWGSDIGSTTIVCPDAPILCFHAFARSSSYTAVSWHWSRRFARPRTCHSRARSTGRRSYYAIRAGDRDNDEKLNADGLEHS